MATRRYSGDLNIRIAIIWNEKALRDEYRVAISNPKTRERATIYVGIPAMITEAIDSPEAYSSAATAALAFLYAEEESGERATSLADDAQSDERGWVVSRQPGWRCDMSKINVLLKENQLAYKPLPTEAELRASFTEMTCERCGDVLFCRTPEWVEHFKTFHMRADGASCPPYTLHTAK